MFQQGRVLWYQPRERTGILQTDCGKELPFTFNGQSPELQGGDIIEFRPGNGNGQQFASDITLIRRCVDDLAIHQKPLVNQFHQTVACTPPANA